MGLRNDIQNALSDAFDSDLSDAVVQIQLIKTISSYDPTTGSNSITENVYDSRAVLDSYSAEEVNNESYLPTDLKAIILQNELSVVPEIDDYIFDFSDRYKVVAVRQDPADAHWELTCRK